MDSSGESSPAKNVEGHWNSLPAREKGNRSKRRRASSKGSQEPQEVGLMRDGDSNGPGRFVGSSSGIHFIRNVYTRLAEKSFNVQGHQTPAESLVPGEDDQLHGNGSVKDDEEYIWTSEEVTGSHGQAPGENHPSFEQLVQWSKSYFEHWHPAFPFLYAPGVLRLFERIGHSGVQGLTKADLLVIRSLVSISLMDARQSITPIHAVHCTVVFKSIADVFSQIQVALSHPASIPLVQATLCVQLFLITILRYNSACRLGGLVTRMAFQIGLHRCPFRYPFTQLEIEMRKRIFWSMYYLERLLCSSLGLPLDINDADLDVCFPDAEAHLSDPDSRYAGEKTMPDTSHLKLLTYLAKYARVRGMIVELRHKSLLHRQNTYSRTAIVQGELSQWMNEVYDEISTDSGDEINDDGPQLSPIHRLLLSILHQESIIALNRPLMTSNPHDPSHMHAVHNCISAARATISALSHFQRRHSPQAAPGDGRLIIPMIWPSLTWAVWMSSFILAYSAADGQLRNISITRHFKEAINVLQHLALRGSPWPNICSSGINDLTSALSQNGAQGTSHGVRRQTASDRQRSQESQTSLNLQPQNSTKAKMNERQGKSHLSTVDSAKDMPDLAQEIQLDVGSEQEPQRIQLQEVSSHNASPSFNRNYANSGTDEYSSPTDTASAPQVGFLPMNVDSFMLSSAIDDQNGLFQGQYAVDPFSAMELPHLSAGQFDMGFAMNANNFDFQMG